jgi:hypothetical protein
LAMAVVMACLLLLFLVTCWCVVISICWQITLAI